MPTLGRLSLWSWRQWWWLLFAVVCHLDHRHHAATVNAWSSKSLALISPPRYYCQQHQRRCSCRHHRWKTTPTVFPSSNRFVRIATAARKESLDSSDADDDYYSLGLRPYRTRRRRAPEKPLTSSFDDDDEDESAMWRTSAASTTLWNNTDVSLLMASDMELPVVNGHYLPQLQPEKEREWNANENNDRQRNQQQSPNENIVSFDDDDDDANTNKRNSTSRDSRERESSFLHSWNYQPVVTPTTTTTTRRTTSVKPPTNNSSKDDRNATTKATSKASPNPRGATDGSATKATNKNNDQNDYTSFFQNWGYQPVPSESTPTNSASSSPSTPSSKTPSGSGAATQPFSWLESNVGASKKNQSLPPPPPLVQKQQQQPQQQQSPPAASFNNANTNQTIYVSVADLEEYLRAQGYVRQSDLLPTTNIAISPKKTTKTSTPKPPSSSSSTSSSSSSPRSGSSSRSGVAFPQKTPMKERDLKIACAICGSSLAAVLAMSVWPNFWLIGGMAGALYGSRVATAAAQDKDGDARAAPSSFVALSILSLGRSLAQLSLDLSWWFQTLWFLYKTGQLSLEYYKQYAALDNRFQIQSKLDAINARFVQAKVDFDAWERQNEVGRKVLASLRTAWIIEEQSLAKRQRQAAREARRQSRAMRSKYRLVQLFLDVYYWFLQGLERLWYSVFGRGRANAWREWKEFWNGVKLDLRDVLTSRDQWRSRIGAVVAAWMIVNFVGALFAISPSILNVATVLLAVLWPSWTSELLDRAAAWLDDIKAKGRSDDISPSELNPSILDPTWEWMQSLFLGAPVPTSSSPPSAQLNLFGLSRYDKTRYNYYRRPDGTKNYYRTGQSVFARFDVTSPTYKEEAVRKQRREARRWSWPWNNNYNSPDKEIEKRMKKAKDKAKRKARQLDNDRRRDQRGLFG